MTYFSVDFSYPGPYDNFGEGAEANKAIFDAEKIIIKMFDELGIKQKHQYMFPDGSLYKWIASDLTVDELRQIIDAYLSDEKVRLHNIHVDDPKCNPYKVRKGKRNWKNKFVACKTLAEYMECP